MPKMKLIRSNIDKNAPLTQKGTVDYWDSGDGSLKGFGLRVGSQSKTFFVQVDVPDPAAQVAKKFKTIKKILGRYGELTPEEARQKAKEEIRHLKETKAPGTGDSLTLLEMMEKYLAAKTFVKGTKDNYRRQLPVKFPGWMNMALKEVALLPPEVMVQRFNHVKEANGDMAARNVFAKLQGILNYAMVIYPATVQRNPCAVISKAKLWPKVKGRTDCLKGAEFKQFYDGIQLFNEVTRDALLFCLYQGCRNREAASLEWQHVDIENAVLRIPNTKNSAALHVPLSSQSVAILRRRKAASYEGGRYVFPTGKAHLNKTGHVALTSHTVQLKTGLKISIHGLRRTFVDIADNKLKLRRQDVDRLVNHVDSSVTGKHYSHKDIDDLREDIQKVGNEIERLMLHGVGAKVTYLSVGQTG